MDHIIEDYQTTAELFNVILCKVINLLQLCIGLEFAFPVAEIPVTLRSFQTFIKQLCLLKKKIQIKNAKLLDSYGFFFEATK